MFEKHLWKSDILNKDVGRWTASSLKMSLFHRCFFTHFAGKNRQPTMDINGTLAGNWLMTFFKLLRRTDEDEDNCDKTIAIFTEHGSKNKIKGQD